MVRPPRPPAIIICPAAAATDAVTRRSVNSLRHSSPSRMKLPPAAARSSVSVEPRMLSGAAACSWRARSFQRPAACSRSRFTVACAWKLA